MNPLRFGAAIAGLSALFLLAACGGSKSGGEAPQSAKDVQSEAVPTRVAPPAPSEAKDMSLPPVQVSELKNGLQVNTIVTDQLPVVYATLVIRSGGESDPGRLPGLSGLVAQMLKEGTTKRSSAKIAEEIEFLGADLWASSDEENTYVGVRALAEQFDVVMGILAEVAGKPAFSNKELQKLKKRELDRLALSEREPRYIARRTFYRQIYGSHPYGTVDTTPQSVKRVRRQDLARWHREHFVAKNSFLVVAGDVDPAQVASAAQKTLGAWNAGRRAAPTYDEPPKITDRSILVVDRPGSVQSVIYMGNLAIARANREWVPLKVANQVLGGSAASRLFMDLREKRSLTYGAYSAVSGRVEIGPFIAYASVRTEVTTEAVGAFFEHLLRINQEPAEPEELINAKRYLSDSFPLKVDTPGKLADLVVELRTFGLADDYWDRYRQAIRATSASEAQYVARNYIRPESALVVIVGQAADFAQSLQQFGPVTVVSPDGEVKARFEDKRPNLGASGAQRGPIR
ncbi:MAG: M16 family metallopeptidase [Polyangiales bacterium]